MKRLLITILLTCVLSTTALAGEIPTVGGATPAPGEMSGPPGPGDMDGPSSMAASIILTLVSLIR